RRSRARSARRRASTKRGGRVSFGTPPPQRVPWHGTCVGRARGGSTEMAARKEKKSSKGSRRSQPGRRKPAGQPAQQQARQPGRERAMRPRPQAEDPNHVGTGKLAGKVALVTGGDRDRQSGVEA